MMWSIGGSRLVIHFKPNKKKIDKTANEGVKVAYISMFVFRVVVRVRFSFIFASIKFIHLLRNLKSKSGGAIDTLDKVYKKRYTKNRMCNKYIRGRGDRARARALAL